MQEPSIFKKIIVLISLLIICVLIGNLSLIGLAHLGGFDIEDSSQIFDAVSDPVLRPYIKAGIGINHLFTFAISSIAFALIIYKRGWLDYFQFKSIDSRLLFLFIILLVAAYPFIGLSSTLFEGIEFPEWMNQMEADSIDALMSMLEMNNGLDVLFNLIIIAAIPAIGEELLFRGIIQKQLVKYLSNPHVAIILASFIFSAIHLQINGLLPKFIIGLILGYAYYWTKSIWYPIIIHFINNGSQTIILFFTGDLEEISNLEPEEPDLQYLIIAAAISSILCFFIVRKIKEVLKENTITPAKWD